MADVGGLARPQTTALMGGRSERASPEHANKVGRRAIRAGAGNRPAPLALLVATPKYADMGLEALDSHCSSHGGVSVVHGDGRLPAWAFSDAAAAVVAALEFQEARGRSGVAVHVVAPALEVGARIWPLSGESAPGPDDDAGGRLRESSGVFNMPRPGTSFIGREPEIAGCIQALMGGGLVTLTGPGGSGKSRLALEVASAIAPLYQDGAYWVDLAQLSEPSSVAATVGRTLGLWLEMESDPGGALADYLRDRQAMIVLDNCEHLLAECRELGSRLVSAGVGVLATSREALGAAEEMVLPVAPLKIPEREDLVGASEAGRLFSERARAVRPNFLVRPDDRADLLAICRRLDGIPLALELAAARTRLLTLAQIAAGLQEGFDLLGSAEATPARQRTLQASFAWSHALCSRQEQALLRRLAVFAGGFTLDAVEAVCEGELLDRIGLLDVLDRLIDRSMVAIDDSRSERRYRPAEEFHQARLGDRARRRDRHQGPVRLRG